VGVLLIGSGIAWFALRRAPTAEAELKQRRLTANASDNFVTGQVISPDGKYVAYGDQSGVHIKLIETGETQTFPPPANIKLGRAYWWPSAWFPDGTRLLATAFEPGRPASLWTVSILGGTPRELRDNAGVSMTSPDGLRIAFSAGPDSNELWMMGANGEDPRKLVTLDANSAFETVIWSPDGQRLAWLALSSPQKNPSWSIWLLADGQKKQVFQSDSVLGLVGWSQTGQELLVKSIPDKGGAPSSPVDISLSTISVRDGKQRSLAQLQATYFQNIRLGPAGSQIAFVTRQDAADSLQVIAAAGGPPKPIITSGDPRVYFSAIVWAPDGKTIYYAKQSSWTVFSIIDNFK